jgi:predicted ATPase/Tfp pilus assembly protein PilF
LGVVLFEMLTGRRPFVGGRSEVLRAIVRDEPAPLAPTRADLPEGLNRIVGKLLSKSRATRYTRARDVIDALARLGASSDASVMAVAAPDRAAGSGRLPAPLTSFVGRERELVELEAIMARTRLLTLTGAAGTGKTRLAARLATKVADEFADGVYFVPLASLADSGLVAPAIAQALGIAELPGRSVLERLTTFLADRQTLLVLDNMEQVMQAAPTVSDLLETCPRLEVVVTSRVALRLDGEHEYPVPALGVPDPGTAHDVESLSEYSAVSLFVDRARAANPGFGLTDQNSAAVAELCRKLDGLPLTIELAAARVKLFTPQAMVARLGQRLDLLKGGPRDRPARQQTLREAMNWSYDLLEEGEQRLFRWISAFVGGFNLDAAERVCGTVTEDTGQLVDRLSLLVDHSLLRSVEAPAEEPRFTMLETIQAYGVERLSVAGELDEARRAHAEYYLELAERAEPELTAEEQTSWLNRLALEHDNLRAALAWAEERGEVEIGLRFAVALWRYWLVRGHMNEGRPAIERLLAMPEGRVSQAVRARALNGLGTIAHNQGDNVEARAVLEESLALFRRIDDRRGIATVLNNLSWVACELCDFETGETLAHEALELCRESNDRRGWALAVNNLGWIANYRGEQRTAQAYHEESLALRREIGDHRGVAFALCNLAWAQQLGGEFEAAEARLAEAGTVLERVKDATLQAWMLAIRARIARDLGEYERALEILEEVRSLWREGGNRSILAWAATSMGEIELARGNSERASVLLAEGLKGWNEIGSTFGVGIALLGLGEVAQAKGEGAKAVRLMRESLTIRHSLADKLGTAECLEGLSQVAVSQSRPRLAAHLLGCADALRDSLNAPLPPVKRAWRESLETVLLRELGREGFDSEWSAGRWTEFEAVPALASELSSDA